MSAPKGSICSPRSSRCGPSPAVLRISQDRIAEKSFLNGAGVATAPWLPVGTSGELRASRGRLGLPAC